MPPEGISYERLMGSAKCNLTKQAIGLYILNRILYHTDMELRYWTGRVSLYSSYNITEAGRSVLSDYQAALETQREVKNLISDCLKTPELLN